MIRHGSRPDDTRDSGAIAAKLSLPAWKQAAVASLFVVTFIFSGALAAYATSTNKITDFFSGTNGATINKRIPDGTAPSGSYWLSATGGKNGYYLTFTAVNQWSTTCGGGIYDNTNEGIIGLGFVPTTITTYYSSLSASGNDIGIKFRDNGVAADANARWWAAKISSGSPNASIDLYYWNGTVFTVVATKNGIGQTKTGPWALKVTDDPASNSISVYADYYNSISRGATTLVLSVVNNTYAGNSCCGLYGGRGSGLFYNFIVDSEEVPPTNTPTNTPTITPTYTRTPEQTFFMGLSTTAGTLSSATNNTQIRGTKKTATKTGLLTAIDVWCNTPTAGYFLATVYADSGTNTPTTLLARSNTYTALVGGWNEFILQTVVPVASGSKYWIGGQRSSLTSTLSYILTADANLSAICTNTYDSTPVDPFDTITWTTAEYALYAIGDDNYYDTNYIGITYTASNLANPIITNMRACKYTALRDGTINKLHILFNLEASGWIKLGVYDGTSATPINLISESGVYPCFAANSLTITPIAINAGSDYWLAWQTYGKVLGINIVSSYYYNNSADNNNLQAVENTFGTFPETFGSPILSQNRLASIYASGIDFTPTATPTNMQTPDLTATPTQTPNWTETPTNTATPPNTATPTNTPTLTPVTVIYDSFAGSYGDTLSAHTPDVDLTGKGWSKYSSFSLQPYLNGANEAAAKYTYDYPYMPIIDLRGIVYPIVYQFNMRTDFGRAGFFGWRQAVNIVSGYSSKYRIERPTALEYHGVTTNAVEFYENGIMTHSSDWTYVGPSTKILDYGTHIEIYAGPDFNNLTLKDSFDVSLPINTEYGTSIYGSVGGYIDPEASVYFGNFFIGASDYQTPTPTNTPTWTPTATPTDSPTASPTCSPTTTPTETSSTIATATPTITIGYTKTPTPHLTPTRERIIVEVIRVTRTPTNTRTMTRTPTPIFSRTSTPILTRTATRTGTRTITPTRTRTATRTETRQPTPTRTSTPIT